MYSIFLGIRPGNASFLLPFHKISRRESAQSGIVSPFFLFGFIPLFSAHTHLRYGSGVISWGWLMGFCVRLMGDRDWDRIKSPAPDQIIPYDQLPQKVDPNALNKLAVLKVNGGLGTSMGAFSSYFLRSMEWYWDFFSFSFTFDLGWLTGMTGAKSALEVKDDMTFLDLTVRQIEHLNTDYDIDVPLILMTSFNTHEDTLRIIKKYANQQLRITTFNQSQYPRISQETLLPCPKSATDEKTKWYPPGHGDLYNALVHSGVLDQLLAEGKEYLFVSNSDNLGAVWVYWSLFMCSPFSEIVSFFLFCFLMVADADFLVVLFFIYLQSWSEHFAAYDRHKCGVYYGGDR